LPVRRKEAAYSVVQLLYKHQNSKESSDTKVRRSLYVYAKKNGCWRYCKKASKNTMNRLSNSTWFGPQIKPPDSEASGWYAATDPNVRIPVEQISTGFPHHATPPAAARCPALPPQGEGSARQKTPPRHSFASLDTAAVTEKESRLAMMHVCLLTRKQDW
jgi:hypothetical protein